MHQLSELRSKDWEAWAGLVLRTVQEEGSVAAGARKLGVPIRTFWRWYGEVLTWAKGESR